MIVIRKEKESNQQVLRRFNRIMQSISTLQDARDKREHVKAPNRATIRRSALRREGLRRAKQWY